MTDCITNRLFDWLTVGAEGMVVWRSSALVAGAWCALPVQLIVLKLGVVAGAQPRWFVKIAVTLRTGRKRGSHYFKSLFNECECECVLCVFLYKPWWLDTGIHHSCQHSQTWHHIGTVGGCRSDQHKDSRCCSHILQWSACSSGTWGRPVLCKSGNNNNREIF